MANVFSINAETGAWRRCIQFSVYSFLTYTSESRSLSLSFVTLIVNFVRQSTYELSTAGLKSSQNLCKKKRDTNGASENSALEGRS